MTTLFINNFSFTVYGLEISYTTEKGKSITASYDPFATCDLFQQLKIIEGFDRDANGEPVILFLDNTFGRPTTGYVVWCDYVRYFGFMKRHAEIIAEYREQCRAFRKQRAQINKLLKPLAAA